MNSEAITKNIIEILNLFEQFMVKQSVLNDTTFGNTFDS